MTKSFDGLNRRVVKINPRLAFFFIVIIGTLALRIFFLFHYGVTEGGDSHFYLENANKIMTSGIHFFKDNAGTMWYWGYPSFLALVFSVVGESSFIAALVQTVLVSFSCVLIYDLIVKFGCREWVACVLVLFYSLNNDVNMWDRYILSDCMGMFWECICLYSFYRLMIDKWDKKKINRKWLVFWMIAMLLFFMTRANAVSLILGMLMILLFSVENKRMRLIVVGTGVGLILIFFIMLAIVGSGKAHGIGFMWDYFTEGFRDGTVVSGRPEYDVVVSPDRIGSPLFIIDMVKILFWRICMYWSIYFGEYSLPHKLLCLATILPTFLLSIWSVIQIIKQKARKYYPLIVMLMFYFVIQVFTEVDFDQRYRSPIFMILILICSFGAHDFYSMVKNRKERSFEEA